MKKTGIIIKEAFWKVKKYSVHARRIYCTLSIITKKDLNQAQSSTIITLFFVKYQKHKDKKKSPKISRECKPHKWTLTDTISY